LYIGLQKKRETNGMYAATLVEIGGQKYYFDTTQDKLEFNVTDKHPDMINGAAMGSEEYRKYYDGKLDWKFNF